MQENHNTAQNVYGFWHNSNTMQEFTCNFLHTTSIKQSNRNAAKEFSNILNAWYTSQYFDLCKSHYHSTDNCWKSHI